MGKKFKKTNDELIKLRVVFQTLGQIPNPVRMCSTRNMLLIQADSDKYYDDKEELHKQYAILDDEGEPVLTKARQEKMDKLESEGEDISQETHSYSLYQYKEKDGFAVFSKKLKALGEKEIEIEGEFHTETLDQNRLIPITNENGSKSYKSMTVGEILDDPNSLVSGNVIGVLLEHKILE